MQKEYTTYQAQPEDDTFTDFINGVYKVYKNAFNDLVMVQTADSIQLRSKSTSESDEFLFIKKAPGASKVIYFYTDLKTQATELGVIGPDRQSRDYKVPSSMKLNRIPIPREGANMDKARKFFTDALEEVRRLSTMVCEGTPATGANWNFADHPEWDQLCYHAEDIQFDPTE